MIDKQYLLRRRRIEDMTIRKIAAVRRIAAETHEGYIHTVNEFELWDVHGDTVTFIRPSKMVL